jgi:hypothetical protein
MTDAMTFMLDRREAQARPGETIWHVARCYASPPGMGE